jgi:hypothetical protein
MKKIIFLAITLIATGVYINSTSFAAGKSKWICFKNNDEVNVAGGSAGEKKASCEKQAGTWIEMVGADVQKDPAPMAEAPKQMSGGGGGW